MSLIVDKIGPGVPLDGYDVSPDYGKYQMVPAGGTRTIYVQTDSRPVNVKVSRGSDLILIGKLCRRDGNSIPGVDPLKMENITYVIPAGTAAQFEVYGKQSASGHAAISVDEIGTDITFSDGIIISVTQKISKKFAFVYISDLLGDVKEVFSRQGIDPRSILRKANTSFLRQLNLELSELDPGQPIGEVTSSKNYGNPIKLDVLIRPENTKTHFAIVSEVVMNFPKLFPSTHFVILLTRPFVLTNDLNAIDVNLKYNTKQNVIFLTPTSNSEDENMKVFMHEVGHACGAEHIRQRPSIMYPNVGSNMSMRFLGDHIEAIQRFGPSFPT